MGKRERDEPLQEREIELQGGQVRSVAAAVAELANCKFPLALALEIRNMVRPIKEVSATFEEGLAEMIKKYADGESEIRSDHPNFREMKKEMDRFLADPVKIRVTPLRLSVLERKAMGVVMLTAESLDILLSKGLLDGQGGSEDGIDDA